jgi:hypothetical protein
MAHWHALAKLRVHTETTIAMLRAQTATLGRRLRRFQSTVAAHYDTVETDYEHEKRKRREARRALEAGGSAKPSDSHKRVVKFNMTTYKLHSIGDYPDAIVLYGTMDSFSTQIVSFAAILKRKPGFHSFIGRTRAPTCQIPRTKG